MLSPIRWLRRICSPHAVVRPRLVHRLDKNGWQGLYGESFIRALACSAGLIPVKKDLEYDGVDFQLGYPGRFGSLRHPAIEVQVKSWSSPKSDGEHYKYPLKVSNYMELVGELGKDLTYARFLFLVIVPKSADDYTSQSVDTLSLRHASYWTSLMEQPLPLQNSSTKTVYIPKRNLLTVDSLLELLKYGQSEGAE